MKYLIFVFFSLSYILCYAQIEPKDPDGDGYKNVSSIEHLKWISEYGYSGKNKYKLINDIDAEQSQLWNNQKGFLKVFYYGLKPEFIFDNHIITNIYIWDNEINIREYYDIIENSEHLFERDKKYFGNLSLRFMDYTPILGLSADAYMFDHVGIGVGFARVASGINLDLYALDILSHRHNFIFSFASLFKFTNDEDEIDFNTFSLGFVYNDRAFGFNLKGGIGVRGEAVKPVIPWYGLALSFRF